MTDKDHKLLSNISVFGNWMLKHQMGWALAYQGVAILERYKRNAGCVVTAGAYLGMESFFYALWFKQVVMFEPVPALYKFVKETFESNTNGCDWAIHNVALGAKKAQHELVTIYHEGYNIVTTPYTTIGKTKLKYSDDTTRKETINIIPLDSLNLKPDLIQLDVEEYEEQALIGSLQTIQEYRPVIQLETVDRSISRLLFDNGYIEVQPWVNYLVNQKGLDRYFIHNSVNQ